MLLKSHYHVGSNAEEIQAQKEEHQAFQDTAKVMSITDTVQVRAFSSVLNVIRSHLGHVRLRLSVTERGASTTAIVQTDRDEEFDTRQQSVAVVETTRRHQSRTIDAVTRVRSFPQKRR